MTILLIVSLPEGFVKVFENSDHARLLDAEMRKYRLEMSEQQAIYQDFKDAHRDARRKVARKSSVYSSSIFHQVGSLVRRQALLKFQDAFVLSISYATTLLIAVILGTFWLQLPLDMASAFTRGGILFISLLFNAFQATGELASLMIGRSLVEKHRSYALHRPSSRGIQSSCSST